VGVEKPNPAIYRKVLEKLHLPASEAVYIGDSLKKDVLGPMEMGMDAVWYVDETVGATPSEELENLARTKCVKKAVNYRQLKDVLMKL
jgi:FMN phosphatase YigB (HAD superfamily)